MLKNIRSPTYLFHMKDSRFGLLSLSCAICIFHWETFEKFLDSHNYINNKLACLVRDGMQHEYVNIVACVCAAFGVYLVIPFHFKIKGKSNHSVLRDFFTELYENLKSGAINEVFFLNLQLQHFQLFHIKCLMGLTFILPTYFTYK